MPSGTIITLDTHCTTPVIAWTGVVGVTNTAANNLFDISSGLDNDVTSVIKGTNCKKQGGLAADITLHTFVNDLDGSGSFQADFTAGDGNYDTQIKAVDNVGNTSSNSNLVTLELDTTMPLVVISSVSFENFVPGYGTAVGKIGVDASYDYIYFDFYWSEAPSEPDGYFVVHVKNAAFVIGDKPSFNNTTKYFSGGGGYPLYDDGTLKTLWGVAPAAPTVPLKTGRSSGTGGGQNGPINSSADAGLNNKYTVWIDTDDILNVGISDTQGNGPGMGTNIFIQVFVADNAGNVSNPS